MKKLIFDVTYHDDTSTAKTVALEFDNFTDKIENKFYIDESPIASEYIPGEFYKRELPAIMSLIENQIGLDKLKTDYDVIVVDGLYMLCKDHLGLGARLKNHLMDLGIDIEVIGIAKTYFHDCEQVAGFVYRGKDATKPLYVNGSSQRDYVSIVENMSGEYRIPYLIKQVDKLCRM